MGAFNAFECCFGTIKRTLSSIIKFLNNAATTQSHETSNTYYLASCADEPKKTAPSFTMLTRRSQILKL